MKRIFAALILVLLAFGFYWLYAQRYTTLPSGDEITLYGNVDIRQVDIAFRVPGQVAQMFFQEGDMVPKGALVAVLDKTPYDHQVRQAEASLDGAKVSLKIADNLLKRRKELIGTGSVSQEDIDTTESTRDLQAAAVQQAEALLAVAKNNLLYTEAYAPTVTSVLTRIREPGSVVKAADPVYTLSVTSPVWIRAYIDEPNLGVVYPGMTAEVITDTVDGRIYQGKVGFISPVAEFTPKSVETTQLRTSLVYRIRVYVDHPDFGLRQGMPVTIKLKRQTSRSSSE